MSPTTLTVNTTEVDYDSKHFIVKKVIFHLFIMHENDKFHHTMQLHPVLSLQKVALPSPFFFFSAMAVLYCIVRGSTINLQVMAVPPPVVINLTIYMVTE